jgi:hypothetical protein
MFLSLIVLLLSSCSTTSPQLQFTGGNYNSVSDDIIIYSAVKEAVSKIANSIDPKERYLLVQVIDDPNNDFIADRIFEELYKRGYVVGKAKNDELATMNTDNFTKYLMFYPTVYGTEHAATRPSIYGKALGMIPYVGWVIMQELTYDDRVAGASIHCRLVDGQTGEIEWIKNFTGLAKIRLSGGLENIVFPD